MSTPKPQRPWLDPYAVLTDEEEAALDEIMADIPRATVEAANRATAQAQQTRLQAQRGTEEEEPPTHG